MLQFKRMQTENWSFQKLAKCQAPFLVSCKRQTLEILLHQDQNQTAFSPEVQ